MKSVENDVSGSQKIRKKPGRAPVSCAECRRLKMRCDRRFPCENCTRRGCATICPDGTLTIGKHNRMILANTEELHDKVETLLERIRLLEDALRTLQSMVSTQPHPLLVNSLSVSNNSTSAIPVVLVQPDKVVSKPQNLVKEPDTRLDSSGTLTIGDEGETNYFGQTARADYLLNDSESEDEVEVRRLPKNMYNYTWPEAPLPDNSLEEAVLAFLPDLNEAYSLCEVYLDVASWLGLLVPRSMIHDEFIAHVYHLTTHQWANVLNTCPHRLALLYTIFSLGALFDPSRNVGNPESDDYYHLARVALSFKSVALETTIYSVLTVQHMCAFLLHRDSPQGHEQAWVMLGIASKLSLTMGLHRDSSRWKLGKSISDLRHAAFWQLYMLEIMASLHFGRPPALCELFIDCPLPSQLNIEQAGSSNENILYLSWRIQFSRLVQDVLQKAFAANPPSYSDILEIDSKLRELADPVLDYTDRSHSVKMQQWSVVYFRESMFILLHRGFLTEALNESPRNPYLSKYKQSVETCFKSSCRLIDGLLWIGQESPDIMSRMSGWLAAHVSPVTILCLIVTRSPTSDLARPAVEKIESVYADLHNNADTSRTAQKNLEIARRLRNMARAALENTKLAMQGAMPLQLSSMYTYDSNEDLDRCCGKTQIRKRKTRTPGSSESREHISSQETNSNFMIDTNPTSSWSARPWIFSGGNLGSSGMASSSNDVVDTISGDSYNAIGHGLDSSWSNFIQQLGF